MRLHALVATLVVGCMGADTVDCPRGGVCPAGTACRIDRGRDVCVPETCGNAELEPGEDCDDGNSVSGDGCQAACRFPERPRARAGSAMAYDANRQMLVMFGGAGIELYGDTWEWDGVEWIERAALVPSPPPRAAASMTFDSVRNRVLMFGGTGDSTGMYLDDTWEWDGAAWRRIDTPGPTGRANASLAFDPVRGMAVLFGGSIPMGPPIGETWEWDGARWARRTPLTEPAPRTFAGMTFDETLQGTILLGGEPDSLTHVWDGTTWSRSDLQYTGPRFFVELTYDRGRGRSVLHGGAPLTSAPEGYHAETWEMLATGWSPVDIQGTPNRVAFGMAYAESIDAVVLFGGARFANGSLQEYFDDLWAWDGSSWRVLP